MAAHLSRLGFRKGDFLAAFLPFSVEHVLLEYACFRLGVIHVPLDLRLKPAEIERCREMVRPRAFASLSPGSDIPVSPGCFDGFPTAPLPPGPGESDGAVVIFTTGSTGAPKPALLSHGNILAQNRCLARAFGFHRDARVLVNLPPSHVGGQAEELMSALYGGGAAVLLETFDAARSLQAIQQHRVTLIGQIPAMFQMEWRLADYARYDLGSLEWAVYGGQPVSPAFAEKLATMAPHIGTGLGLTEAAGFCTYTGDILASVGHPDPSYPMSIREPMRPDGSAGPEIPDGSPGHICFHGRQTFLGYVNDPESTARAVSSDGWLYTGDLGFRDAAGLHFSGRAKWVIKPAGYQVFPADVENHLSAFPAVAAAGVVGVPHEKFSEAIVAFVERKPGAELGLAALKRHARGMASYMRPLHYIVLEPGGLPLNRAVKTDYVRLSELALAEVERLRARRRWDR